MKAHHFLANTLLTFLLFLILSSPLLFSTILVGFGQENKVLGISVGNLNYNYLLNVNVENQKKDFKRVKVNYQRIPNALAFYPQILKVSNDSTQTVEVKLFDFSHNRADVFFASNDEKTGPKSYFLKPGEQIFVSLTANIGDLLDEFEFSLESF